ncbi:MAG: outer membrane lipoprotein chaperone LolA [Candidatus Thiodiazotropha sp. (ex Gloverina cf. vestifex)]|nr:outer membrane lipoprotein chaperone LolA [Candidatus Thiodiazotropha sp. (ex Gloverina cf. vestifex)]
MNFRLLTLIACLLTGISQALWAADGTTQFQTFLKDLDTLQAEFRQTIQRPDEDTVYATNGIFYLKRPGQLRWEYEDPATQVIVADGKRIWLHDIELEQVSHRSQKAALEGTPAQLLSGTGPIDEDFELLEQGESDGLTWLELIPKEKDAQFAKVRLGLLENELQRMEMHDSFGQITRFIFYNIARNPALSTELFVFVPPPQIDLIGDL